MDNDVLLLKKRIIEAAINLYLNDSDRFTVDDVAEAAEVTKETFYEHFDSLSFVLPAFYVLCLAEYRTVRAAIGGYESFTLEERLSTFIYVMFDFLEEQQAFVAQTFEEYVMDDHTARFRKEVKALFRELLDTDDVPTTNRFFTDRDLLHGFLTNQYLLLVSYWIKDESPQREKTVALADKLVAFFAELATFRGIERGVDLVKYLVNIDLIDLDNIPFVGRWFEREETKDET